MLHGDLHHDNILSSQRGWLAIDPHGVVGEPAYEVGAFIRNPLDILPNEPRAKEIIEQRLDLFSKGLHIEKEKFRQWSYVNTVLAACWLEEDGSDPKNCLKIAALVLQ